MDYEDYGSHLFKGFGGLEVDGESVNVMNFNETWSSLYFKSGSSPLALSSDVRYKLYMWIEGYDDLTATLKPAGQDISNTFSKDVRIYFLYGGQKYYFTEYNGRYSLVLDFYGENSDVFDIGVEFDLYHDNYDATSPNTYYVYQYMFIMNSFHCTLYSLTGNNSLNTGDSIINNNISQGNQLQEQGNQLQQEQNETTNNIFQSISDFFGSFFDNLIGIFVPEDGYFEDFFNRLNDFFSDKLGMLYAPIDMFLEFLDVFLTADSSDAGITFPEIKWEEHVIIPETKVSLGSYSEEFPQLQEGIYFATDVIMVGAVFMLLQNKLKEVMQN